MVDAYSGNDLLYLNPKGTIPTAAVIKDRHRDNPFKEKRLFDATSFPQQGVEMEEEDEDEVEIDKQTRIETEG